MTILECDEAGLLMCPEIDGELAVANSVALTKHLMGCLECSEKFEQLNAVSQKVRKYSEQLDLPANLEKNIHFALNKEKRSSANRFYLKLVSTAAASIVGLGILVLLFLRPQAPATSLETLVAETGHAAKYSGKSRFKILSSNRPFTTKSKNAEPFNLTSMKLFKVAAVDTIEGPDGRQIVRTCYEFAGPMQVCVDRYDMPKGLLAIGASTIEQLNGRSARYEKVGAQSILCFEENGREVVYASAVSKDILLGWLQRKT